jgi:hypothetical protein
MVSQVFLRPKAKRTMTMWAILFTFAFPIRKFQIQHRPSDDSLPSTQALTCGTWHIHGERALGGQSPGQCLSWNEFVYTLHWAVQRKGLDFKIAAGVYMCFQQCQFWNILGMKVFHLLEVFASERWGDLVDARLSGIWRVWYLRNAHAEASCGFLRSGEQVRRPLQVSRVFQVLAKSRHWAASGQTRNVKENLGMCEMRRPWHHGFFWLGQSMERTCRGAAVATARSSPPNTQRGSQTRWQQHKRSTKERGQADVFEPGSRPTSEAVGFKVKRGSMTPWLVLPIAALFGNGLDL